MSKKNRSLNPLGRGAPGDKTEQILLRVSPQEKRRLKAEAKRRGVTVSELLMKPWRLKP